MKIIEKIKEMLKQLKSDQKKSFLSSLIELVKAEGKRLSPRNFVWKCLSADCLEEKVLVCSEKRPEELSPGFVASILRYGQILPVFITPSGRIVDGRARYTVLKDSVEYLILPYTDDELLSEIRVTSEEVDPVKKEAEKVGEEMFLKRLNLNSLRGKYAEEIRAAVKSIAADLSLPEKVSVYVLLRERQFWKMVAACALRRLDEIEAELSRRRE